MGNRKNQRKPANPKVIAKTRKNMEKDADELSVTNEEMHADTTTPTPPRTASGSQKHTRDTPSEEEDDEDDVSGERPTGKC